MSEGRGLHFLVADYNPISLRLMAAYAEIFGWSITTVSDCRAAKAAANERPFSGLIFDYRMPDATGLQAVVAIRRGTGPNRCAPALIWTDEDTARIGAMAKGVPALSVLRRPIDRQDLRAWAEAWASPESPSSRSSTG